MCFYNIVAQASIKAIALHCEFGGKKTERYFLMTFFGILAQL
jgi:hypothetical protein